MLTINRNLTTIRRFFGWLVEQGHVAANPGKPVKDLKRTALAPKGLDRAQVRKLLREIELRGDIRANAIFSVMLYSGCRVGDLVDLDLHDLIIGERSGSVVFRYGKGDKQRVCPLPIAAAKPSPLTLNSGLPFNRVGCSSAKGDRSRIAVFGHLQQVQRHLRLQASSACAAPHIAHQYLENNPGDLVGLSALFGHESLNTTARYAKKSEGSWPRPPTS